MQDLVVPRDYLIGKVHWPKILLILKQVKYWLKANDEITAEFLDQLAQSWYYKF